VVQTLAGSVAGKVEETKLHGIFVEKFLNIHYAEAPEGKLRFMKPRAKKPWKGKSLILHSFLFIVFYISLLFIVRKGHGELLQYMLFV
jgi:hypothetical protein